MTDITELFSRDPLSYSRGDLPSIVAHFRAQRANFELGVKTEKVARVAKAKAPKAIVAPGAKLSLGDLFKKA